MTKKKQYNKYPSKYSPIKNHTYLYHLAGNPYIEGDKYKNIYVTQINFNNGYSKDNKDIKLSLYEFLDSENNLLIEGIKDYEIYLAPCKEICYNEANKLENYLAMFTVSNYDEMRRFAGNDKEALCVVQELEKLSQEKYFGALYDASIVQKKLENPAKDEGIKQRSLEKSKTMALSMLRDNVDIKMISKYTGLDILEIEKLQEN